MKTIKSKIKSLIQKLEKIMKKLLILGFAALAVSCSKKDDDDNERSFDLGDGTFKLEKIEEITFKMKNQQPATLSTKFTHGSEPFGLIIKWNEDKEYFDVKYTGKGTLETGETVECKKKDFSFIWGLNSDGGIKDKGIVRNVEHIEYNDCKVAPFDYYWNAHTYSTFKIKSAGIPDGFIIEIERKNPKDYNDDVEFTKSKAHFKRIAK